MPRDFASSMAASISSGAAPRNLTPSAPVRRTLCTQSRAASGDSICSGNTACTIIRGAAISLRSLKALCSRVHFRPITAPTSRTVVMPWASQSLSTYSGAVSLPE